MTSTTHYEQKKFDRLYGTHGFSDTLLKNHFTLYQGYVTNTNKLLDEFSRLRSEGKTETPEFAELRRRFGWEWNGMRLHEYYFGNMTKEKHPFDRSSEIAQKMEDDFGSYDLWLKEFQGIGAMRGIGWAAIYYDSREARLCNAWINEHDGGHLAGAEPILIMDVFEHAYMTDYGIKKAGYMEAFLNAICWRTVEERFEMAYQRVEFEQSLRQARAA